MELCSNPLEGGTTPSFGMMKELRRELSIPLFAMIRPRGGDFIYSHVELEVMKRDIELAIELGLDGIVFGALTEEGVIDKKSCLELIHAAKGLEMAFHRAFDLVNDPLEALEELIELGFDRLLSSGQQATALEGKGLLKKLVKQADKRIIIMPGSGINAQNASEIVRYTGVEEIHFSARKFIPSRSKKGNIHPKGFGPMVGDRAMIQSVDLDTIGSIIKSFK